MQYSDPNAKTLIDTTGREVSYTHKRPGLNNDMHRQNDFLRGGPGDPMGVGADVGESNTRHTRFTKGFFRRPAHVINPYEQRYKQEEEDAERRARRAYAREEYLSTQNTRCGNVVNTMQGAPHEDGLLLKNVSDSSMQKHQSKRPVGQFQTEGENRARQMASGSRFYAVNDQKAEERRRQRMEANIMRQIGSSSVLGFGRKDLPSYGVWDNFRFDEEKRNSSRSPSQNSMRGGSYDREVVSQSPYQTQQMSPSRQQQQYEQQGGFEQGGYAGGGGGYDQGQQQQAYY